VLIPDNFGRAGERQILWELPFVRLIHLLAHHPDLDFDGDDVDPDILKMGAKLVFLVLYAPARELTVSSSCRYLEEYLEIFATAENISFLYSLASKLKTVRDRQDRRYDRVRSLFDCARRQLLLTYRWIVAQNLYLLSELSQYLIRSLGARHSWPIPTYPAQIALPTDIFEAIKDDDECRRIVKKTYLDEDVLRKLEAKSEKKRGVSAGKKRAPDGVADGEAKPKKRVKTSPSAKKKAGPAPKRKAAAAKKKKVDKWNSDAEDEEDELSSEASDEDEADSDAGVVARLTPKRQSAAKTTRGQRGGLRSHQSPSKKPSSTANKGKGKGSDVEEEEDPNDDKMSVDSQDDEEEEEVAKPSSRKARAANGTAPRKSPAKPKKQAVKASPVAKKNGKKVAAASESAAPGKTRRALRGLAEPRKLKKAAAAVDELSDIGESGSDDEDKENESE
jgi:sister-chromatid-cohesion protein PDS5